MYSNGNGNGNGNGHHSRWDWLRSLGRSRPSASDMSAYRRIALQLHYDLPRGESSRSVLLVTPTPSEAGVNASFAVARSLGEEIGRPVLLVDACPRQAAASKALDCVTMRGYADLLSGCEESLREMVMPTNSSQVSFLCAGIDVAGAHAASPERMTEFLREAEARYDFVVLYGGPVLHDTMGLGLAPHVGCVLLITLEHETRVEELDSAQQALSFCNPRKMGLVFATGVRDGWTL